MVLHPGAGALPGTAGSSPGAGTSATTQVRRRPHGHRRADHVRLEELLGDDAEGLLEHDCKTVPRVALHLPGPDFVDRVLVDTDRNSNVLRNLQWLFNSGRLAGTGYVSILPVDQGIEHSAGASFAPEPDLLRPREHRAARDRGRLQRGRLDRRRPRRGQPQVRAQVPVHREAQPQRAAHLPQRVRPDPVRARVQRAYELGAAGVGATIYFGSEESNRQIVEVSEAFEEAHQLGMFTVLWCYLRNPAFKVDGIDYHLAADLTGRPTTSA